MVIRKGYIEGYDENSWQWDSDIADSMILIDILHKVGYGITLDNEKYKWNFQIWKNGYRGVN